MIFDRESRFVFARFLNNTVIRKDHVMPQPSLLSRWFATLDRDRRLLVQLSLLFAASGLFHVVVWMIDGGAWAGDVSWRKPIVFGFSGAVTTASLAWALGAVRADPARRRWVDVYVTAMTLEIALITVQRWRGVASHFNTDTLFDAVVFQAMGGLILTASVPIVRWAVAVTRDRTLDLERRVAVGGGLWLLVVGLAIGIVIAPLGSAARALADADLIAAARGLVPAHAIALHGIQLMAFLSFVLPRRIDRPALRVLWLGRAIVATLALTILAAAVGVMS